MKRLILFAVALVLILTGTVMAQGAPLIHTDKDVYQYGETIQLYFYNAPGYPRDWICIVPVGSADTEAGNYQYIPAGTGQGVLVFQSPRPGQYEARAYYYYIPLLYAVSARYRFSVEGEGSGYEDQYGAGYDYQDEYVDVPIVYGEPRYYAPPVAVTFAFDYFTYELFGPYVDIVFWKGGHRYRSERWYDHGRRITSDDIRTNPFHRIRGAEFYNHREQLQRNHHIVHPDNVYGRKHPEQPAKQQPSPEFQKPPWEQKRIPRMEQLSPWEPGESQRKAPSLQPMVKRPPREQQQVENRSWWQQKLPQREQQFQQRRTWEHQQSQQVKQRPQSLERRPQWAQSSPQQIQPRLKPSVERPYRGQGQIQPQQARQRPQPERRPSQDSGKRKPSTEKHRAINER